ncbi:MAG: hypothetical protein ACJ76V_01350 [Thermoleophilaceae bacterium]
MGSRLGFATAVAVALIAPAAAQGDGLPVPVDDAGPSGLVSRDGASRYVTLTAAQHTLVQRIAPAGGKVQRWRFLPGRLTIPVVSLDGTPSGLSADGKTLVVIKPRSGFPRASTELAILDPRTLRVRRTVTLRGDFSFDALSPDGRSAFLVHYLSRRDPTQYEVRALDVASGKLRARPVVDPHEEPGAMRGLPLTRVTSADGRWHYTLYDGAGKEPFIHALDTSGARAVCIDMPLLTGRQDLYELRLGLRPSGMLSVSSRSGPLALVDTRSFRVSKPVRGAGRVAPGGSSPWPAALLGAALLLLSAVALSVRRRRRPARAA